MIGEITVLKPEDYTSGRKLSTSGMSLAQNGERLFASMGCNACHSGAAAGARGPNLAGVYGSKLQLANGSDGLRQRGLSPRQYPESVAARHRRLRSPSCPRTRARSAKTVSSISSNTSRRLQSNYRVQQTLTTNAGTVHAVGAANARAVIMSTMSSTILSLPDQSTATIPKRNYLNNEHGMLSWLLTGDHKRIAILYLISITFFFFIGGAFAGLIRLELLTPQPDLVASDTYNKFFTMHGIVMIFLFLVPSVPATLGNFLIPIMLGAKDLAFPKINLLSWYLYMAGGLMTLAALVLGGVDTGWTFTTPLSTHYLNTHVITAATASSSPASAPSSPGSTSSSPSIACARPA